MSVVWAGPLVMNSDASAADIAFYKKMRRALEAKGAREAEERERAGWNRAAEDSRRAGDRGRSHLDRSAGRAGGSGVNLGTQLESSSQQHSKDDAQSEHRVRDLRPLHQRTHPSHLSPRE